LEELLIQEDQKWVKVLSGSMGPLAPVGSKVLIQALSDHHGVRFGDIIVFREVDRLIMHRVLGKHRRGGEIFYLQSGDTYSQPSFTHKCGVLGKVIAIQKDGRLIKLDTFRGKLLNIYSALLSRTNYHLDNTFIYIKERMLKGKKVMFFSLISRIMRVPLKFLSTAVTKGLIRFAGGPSE
jgi:signal peptidase I